MANIISIISAATLILPAPTRQVNKDVPCAASAASVEICADGRSFCYTDEYICPSDFTVAEEIESRRINSSLESKLELVDEYLKKGANHKTALSVCFPLLVRTVDEVARYVYVPPVDSEVRYEKGVFYATDEKEGRALDEDKLYAGIYYCFKYGVNNSLCVSYVRLSPKKRRADIEPELSLIGEYRTDFRSSTRSRAHNVALALEKIDGVKICKGATLSFNGVVGERTEDNGFQKAKIIMDGEYIDGVGGGVCQASTALYNAALAAGLKCVANSHSICPSYCPPGLDAMISSVSDLTVINTTDSDVYISARTHDGVGVVRIFGKSDIYSYVPQSKTLNVIPHDEREIEDKSHKYFGSNAQKGDRILVSQGSDGYESVTYICKYSNGKLVSREQIRHSYYKAVPRIIAVAP